MGVMSGGFGGGSGLEGLVGVMSGGLGVKISMDR